MVVCLNANVSVFVTSELNIVGNTVPSYAVFVAIIMAITSVVGLVLSNSVINT